MSLGEYKKARGNTDGEEDEEISSSRRDDPSVGSRRPREDDSDASCSKRSRSGSDRPLADAGPLSSPRSGGDSTPSGVVVSRTAPVRDPWTPTPSEIQSRFSSTALPSQYALYSCNGIIDDDATKDLDFDPSPDQRRDYYIGLFHELRWYGNKKTSRRSRVPEWQAISQSWGAFVGNFNKDPADYRERVRLARERYERFSKRPKIDRLHWGCSRSGCSVRGADGHRVRALPRRGSARVRGINGYTAVRVPEELKTLRTSLIAQMSSSAGGGRSTLSRAVGDYSSRSIFSPFGVFGGGGLCTPSPFPERPASGRSVASRVGSGPPDSVDRLEAVEHFQSAEFAALRQELVLLKAQIAQVSQTASNVQVDLGSRLVVLRTRVGALEQPSSPSHQD
ncbi:unnamed protein product [Phytophthora fragariaefolia]|uniref:Unnamed protein product n=1 Tax=Phytophthora fragariaefolia TaxID=1490495 RepID=A0A9W7D7U6_9STRA|nr:unnamed protein product [Phytophthora fragariaefolia]